jgi:hypothetical protein
MFRRAAALSLQSMKRWQQPAGDLFIVKNKMPPDRKFVVPFPSTAASH